MRPVWLLVPFLPLVLGCPGATVPPPPPVDPGATGPHSELASDDNYQPTYGKAELGNALIAERGAEATNERLVTELEAREGDAAIADRLRVARADLTVRRHFIAALEACQATGAACPPRLDEPSWSFDPDPDGPPVAPKIDATLRFDLESWQKIAVEMHGRACACRTMECVDSVGVAIDQLEPKPMPEVQGDEAASRSIMRARECLFRLRGAKATPGAQPTITTE